MLSRVAESLYWIGRYTERAESTARILDVYSHSVLEDRSGQEESACVRLLDALGLDPDSAEPVEVSLDGVHHSRRIKSHRARLRALRLDEMTCHVRLQSPETGGCLPESP